MNNERIFKHQKISEYTTKDKNISSKDKVIKSKILLLNDNKKKLYLPDKLNSYIDKIYELKYIDNIKLNIRNVLKFIVLLINKLYKISKEYLKK